MKHKLLIFFVLLSLLIAQSLSFSVNRTLAQTTCCIGSVSGNSCINEDTKANYKEIICNNLGGSCTWTCANPINPPAGCSLPSGSPLTCDNSGNIYSCNTGGGTPEVCCGSSSVCTNLNLTPVSVSNTNPAAPVPGVVWGKWYSPTVAEFYAKIYGSPDQEIFGERYTFAQVVWIINSISLLFQFDITSQEAVTSLQELFGLRTQPSMYSMAPLGPIGMIMGSIADMYNNPPASGIQYLTDGLKKFNIATPAVAQGYGYTNTEIVRPLWTASRNISYFLMVILLIAAGFMIMFRVKVNAQTAVSIQVMIPKIIITLLLITFSYAIGGLIIDLIYLVLTLVISMLSTQGIVNNLGSSVRFFTGGYAHIFIYYTLGWLVLGLTMAKFLGAVGGAGAIISIVMIIILAVLLAKVWWMLVKTYVSLLLGFILAPWQILLGLVPGQKGGFGSWLKSMLANASVFVITPLMFLLSMYLNRWDIESLLQQATTGLGYDISWLTSLGFSNGLSTPAFGNNAVPTLPLLGGMAIGMYFIASLAILALIPKAAEAIKKALSVASFGYGSAFGEALTTPGSIIGSDRTAYYGGRIATGLMPKTGDADTWNERLKTIGSTMNSAGKSISGK